VPFTWADLLIEDVTLDDFGRWMSEWGDFIGGQVAPAFMSKFGTWFLRRPQGHVEMLDVFTGGVERMANSYEAFIAEVNQQWWQEVYLLSELVFRLHEVSKIPGPGQTPMAGQPVDPKFVIVMEIGLWQSLCAQAVRAAL
jgi:hypothetical protein